MRVVEEHSVTDSTHEDMALRRRGGREHEPLSVKAAWCFCLAGIRRLCVPDGHAKVS